MVIFHVYSTPKFSVLHPISLYQAAINVFCCSHEQKKAENTLKYVSAWRNGEIVQVFNELDKTSQTPSEPARPYSHFQGYHFASDSSIPADKRSKIKNIMKKNGIEYTIHGIANAELYAVDLFWDIILRYIKYTLLIPQSQEFFDDMVFIVEQEATHFLAWKRRLEDYGYFFGEFPYQEGLWQSANDTKDHILHRLSVINLTHEAKGLDTFQKTKEKFVQLKDWKSCAILDNNYVEEIGHVKFGVKWFRYICEQEKIDPVQTFHQLSRQYFRGKLKEPFNHDARLTAGLTPDWYLPLAEGQ